MTYQTNKTFIWWSFKKIDWKYWEFYWISLKKEDLDKLPFNEKGFINLNINRRQQADKRGNEYYITLNEYTPKENWGFVKKEEPKEYMEDLPF